MIRWSMKSGRGTNCTYLARALNRKANIPHYCVCPSSCPSSVSPRTCHLRRVNTDSLKMRCLIPMVRFLTLSRIPCGGGGGGGGGCLFSAILLVYLRCKGNRGDNK